MKKQRTVTKTEESRIEAVLDECIREAVGVLMEARRSLHAQTTLLSDDARKLVISNALYRFLKVMWFNDANYDEDKAITNRNITEYEEFANEIIGKAFVDMCDVLDKWRPARTR